MQGLGTPFHRRLVESAHRVFVGGLESSSAASKAMWLSRFGPMPAPSEIHNDGLPSRPYPMARPKSSCRENPSTPGTAS
jgi:hypothetical protein